MYSLLKTNYLPTYMIIKFTVRKQFLKYLNVYHKTKFD